MPDPNQSAPPSFYNNMAQMGGGAAAPAGAPGAPAPGGDDSEVLDAMAKMAKALKKIEKMKDGAKPYVDRIMSTMKELVVDVFKADPKSLDAASASTATPTDNATPPVDTGTTATPPPSAGAPA